MSGNIDVTVDKDDARPIAAAKELLLVFRAMELTDVEAGVATRIALDLFQLGQVRRDRIDALANGVHRE